VIGRFEQTKREKMLLDESVCMWHDDPHCGSPITAEVNLRSTNLFCESHGLAPGVLAEMAKSNRRKVEDLLNAAASS